MRLGADDIQEYILSLGDYLRQKIRDIPEVSEAFHFEREHSSNLIMLEVPERLELTGAKLRKAGIRVKVNGKTKIRVGIHYYNNEDDIDKLIDYLKACLEK